MKPKIHRATVTQADLHYVGPVTVDADQTKLVIAGYLASHTPQATHG